MFKLYLIIKQIIIRYLIFFNKTNDQHITKKVNDDNKKIIKEVGYRCVLHRSSTV
jgi:hypothetical protein